MRGSPELIPRAVNKYVENVTARSGNALRAEDTEGREAVPGAICPRRELSRRKFVYKAGNIAYLKAINTLAGFVNNFDFILDNSVFPCSPISTEGG